MNKSDFPFFVNNPEVVYFDNAASVHKPQKVIDGISDFLSMQYSNIHRGRYKWAELSEDRYRQSKESFARLINGRAKEVIYTYNATYGFNLVAQLLEKNQYIQSGDVILVGIGEHHANIVPWQMVAERTGANVEFIALGEDWDIDWQDLQSKLTKKVKIVSHSLASNVTGKVYDIAKLRVLVGSERLLITDASQALASIECDVQRLGVDMLIGTAHKMMADTGLGMVWMKPDLINSLEPVR